MAKRLDKNVILLVVFGVLAAAAGVKAFISKDRYDTGETAKAAEPLFPGFKKDEVTFIVVDGPEGKKAELEKAGDHWKLAGEGDLRADKSDVDRVLNGLEKLKQGKSVSSKADNLAAFNLDADKAVKVTVYGKEGKGGKPVADFAIGKNPQDWKTAFLKLPGENAIRKSEAASSDFEPGVDATWRDKTIFDQGPADKIEQVEIDGPKGAIVLAREKVLGPKEKKDDAADPSKAADPTAKTDEAKDPTKEGESAAGKEGEPETEVKEVVWNLVAPTPGRAKKWLADSIGNQLAKLECDSFFEGKESLAELGLDPPAYAVKIRREGETEAKVVLLLGNKNKDGKYPAKVPDQPTLWWIANWKGDYLTKSADELLETPPKPPEEPKPAEGNDADGKPADGAAGEPPPAGAPDKPDSDGQAPEKPPADPAKPNDGGNG